jgi:hypothetical protein
MYLDHDTSGMQLMLCVHWSPSAGEIYPVVEEFLSIRLKDLMTYLSVYMQDFKGNYTHQGTSDSKPF